MGIGPSGKVPLNIIVYCFRYPGTNYVFAFWQIKSPLSPSPSPSPSLSPSLSLSLSLSSTFIAKSLKLD